MGAWSWEPEQRRRAGSLEPLTVPQAPAPTPFPPVGNAAMAAWVRSLTTVTQPLVQRLNIDVTMSGHSAHDKVTSVNYDSSRVPGNIAGHQGDHTTAFLTFKSMVRNHVMGKTIAEARAALDELLDNVMLLPGAAVKVRNTEYLFAKADGLRNDIAAVRTALDLEQVMETLVELRNELGLTSELHNVSTGGHGEAGNNALLEECDDRLRRGNPRLRYTAADMVNSMWALLDYHPTDGADDDRIVATVAQHAYSMQLAYPHIFATDDDEQMIPGTVCASRRDFFYDALDRALRANPQLVFGQLSDQARVRRLLASVSNAITSGPSVLTPIGASARYQQHLAAS